MFTFTKPSNRLSRNVVYICLFSFLLTTSVGAQQTTGKRYTTTAEDYNKRSSFEVDPVTLALNIKIDLAELPGRGTGLPVTLNYNSKLWRVSHYQTRINNQGEVGSYLLRAVYSEKSRAGWTTNLGMPRIERLFDTEKYVARFTSSANNSPYAPGEPDHGKPYDSEFPPVNPQNGPQGLSYFSNRAMIYMPDGSSHEIRQDDLVTLNNAGDANRMYYAVDGSQIRYNPVTKTIFMPDGSRYNLILNAQYQTVSGNYIDRNGNTYNYTNGDWTDTLGRSIGNPLGNTYCASCDWGLLDAHYGVSYWFIRWNTLDQVRDNPNQPLQYVGGTTRVPGSNPATFSYTSPSLFYRTGLGLATNTIGEVETENPFNAGTPPLFNPKVMSEIELPNGKKFQFKYNEYGEIVKIILPSGGYRRYRYDFIPSIDANSQGIDAYSQSNRGVVEAWESETGTLAGENPVSWKYEVVSSGGFYVKATAPDGTYTKRFPILQPSGSQFGSNYGDVIVGKVYAEQAFDASGQMLRRVLSQWNYSGAQNHPPIEQWTINNPIGMERASRNPYLERQVEVIMDPNGTPIAKATVFQYDGDLNRTNALYYGYKPVSSLSMAQTGTLLQITGTGGANLFDSFNLLKSEEVTYIVNETNAVLPQAGRDAYRALNMIGLVSTTRVKDGSGTVRAQSQIKYDEGGAYDIIPYTGITVTGWINPGTGVKRGDPTTVRNWVHVDGVGAPPDIWIETHAQYDQCGNVCKTWDGEGNMTQTSYVDSYDDNTNHLTYAYPTQVTSPGPALTTKTKYNFNTGKVKETLDANNIKTRYEYLDSLMRPTKEVRGDGTSLVNQTAFSYNDTDRVITVVTDRDANLDGILQSKTMYDGLGRTWRTTSLHGSGQWSITDTEFDVFSRVKRTSNPYLAAVTTGSINPSGVWATNTYDALSRTISVQTPDNATVTTAYDGVRVMVTDQAGKKRISETDALGRLIKTCEVTNNNTDPEVSTIAFPGLAAAESYAYITAYLYDALDNLVQTIQAGKQGTPPNLTTVLQLRTFEYDSVKRLVKATNPENGVTKYTYDNNGNLKTKEDARTAKVTFSYDALNRVTQKIYDGTTTEGVNAKNATPSVFYKYDNQTLPGTPPITFNRGLALGRLVSATYGTVSDRKGSYYGYDELGRVVRKTQQIDNSPYSITANYNRAGAMLSETYPSGRTVTYTYDAAGRATSTVGTIGDGTSRSYTSGINYNVTGQLTKETWGTTQPLYHRRYYNNRFQLFNMRVGTDSSTVNDTNNSSAWTMASQDRGSFMWYYNYNSAANTYAIGDGGMNNNGNVWCSANYVPLNNTGSWVSMKDAYKYDPLNRITEAKEESGGSTTPSPLIPYTQTYEYDRFGNRKISTGTFGSINGFALSFDKASNRINSSGYDHDSAGNLNMDTGQSRTYDAENRMVSAAGGGSNTYVYDGEGKRVKRTPAGVEECWYVYGISGELLAEYGVGATSTVVKKEYGYRNGQLLVIADNQTLINLSQGQFTQQSSTTALWGGGASSRAVDGNTSGVWSNNSVTHTDATNSANLIQPWWEVDLGAVKNIANINMWNRTDCCAARLSNFYVFVSDAPYTSTNPTTTQGQAGVSSYYTAGQAPTTLTLTVNRTGRYVRVQLTSTTEPLSLAEVQVMGVGATTDMKWLATDHLSSTRMEIGQTGTLASVVRHDYLPFGEELAPTVGVRATNGSGYITTSTRQKFGAYERDNETGLDFAQARYHSNMQGRFTSPDNPLVDQDLTDPQSLNLYSYVRNRPLAHTDRNGRACYNGNSGSGYCKRAAEYRNYDADPAVREKTRFFAAAAVVSEVNATGDPQISSSVAGTIIGGAAVLGRKVISISGSTHSALSSIGQELQKLNATAVQDIRDGKLGGPDLDAKLVHLEQSAVQGQLDNLKKSDIGKYNTLINETNSILNPSGLTLLGTKRYSTDSAFVTKILDPVRKQLGGNIDFSNQQHRELIGNTLVKYIRDGGCDVGTISGCK